MTAYRAVVVGLLVLATGCQPEPPTASPAPTQAAEAAVDSAAADTSAAALLAQAEAAVAALDDRNWSALARLVHPQRGVRFSPYGFVDTAAHRRFSPAEVGRFGSDTTLYQWGFYDGTGEPIRLTVRAYWKAFLYGCDFETARHGAPGEVLQRGNTRLNLAQVYPRGTFVEYHVPAADSSLNWRSLRLVFVPTGSGWRLVGLVNDQWTI